MKSFSLLFSALSFATVGAVERLDSTLDLDEIRSLVASQLQSSDVYAILNTLPGGSNSRSSHGDDGDCLMDDLAFYNTTALAPASLLSFLGAGVYADPNFVDVDTYFESINFSTECEALGGEVYEVGLSATCGEPGSVLDTLTTWKLCKPPSCEDEFVYLLTNNAILMFFASFFGCSLEYKSDIIPSMACAASHGALYNTTELAPYALETYVFTGIPELEVRAKMQSFLLFCLLSAEILSKEFVLSSYSYTFLLIVVCSPLNLG